MPHEVFGHWPDCGYGKGTGMWATFYGGAFRSEDSVRESCTISGSDDQSSEDKSFRCWSGSAFATKSKFLRSSADALFHEFCALRKAVRVRTVRGEGFLRVETMAAANSPAKKMARQMTSLVFKSISTFHRVT
jgi:hypothetical protein